MAESGCVVVSDAERTRFLFVCRRPSRGVSWLENAVWNKMSLVVATISLTIISYGSELILSHTNVRSSFTTIVSTSVL